MDRKLGPGIIRNYEEGLQMDHKLGSGIIRNYAEGSEIRVRDQKK